MDYTIFSFNISLSIVLVISVGPTSLLSNNTLWGLFRNIHGFHSLRSPWFTSSMDIFECRIRKPREPSNSVRFTDGGVRAHGSLKNITTVTAPSSDLKIVESLDFGWFFCNIHEKFCIKHQIWTYPWKTSPTLLELLLHKHCP